MKKGNIFFIMCIILITLLFCGSKNAMSMNTGFSTDSMTLESPKNFLSNIQLLLITEEPEKTQFNALM